MSPDSSIGRMRSQARLCKARQLGEGMQTMANGTAVRSGIVGLLVGARLGLALAGNARAQGLGKAEIEAAINAAHAKYKGLKEGKNADYIPALAKVPSGLFGIAVVTVDGQAYTVGDVTQLFSIQSIS